jgi:hypothetical protein
MWAMNGILLLILFMFPVIIKTYISDSYASDPGVRLKEWYKMKENKGIGIKVK